MPESRKVFRLPFLLYLYFRNPHSSVIAMLEPSMIIHCERARHVLLRSAFAGMKNPIKNIGETKKIHRPRQNKRTCDDSVTRDLGGYRHALHVFKRYRAHDSQILVTLSVRLPQNKCDIVGPPPVPPDN